MQYHMETILNIFIWGPGSIRKLNTVHMFYRPLTYSQSRKYTCKNPSPGPSCYLTRFSLPGAWGPTTTLRRSGIGKAGKYDRIARWNISFLLLSEDEECRSAPLKIRPRERKRTWERHAITRRVWSERRPANGRMMTDLAETVMKLMIQRSQCYKGTKRNIRI